MEGELPQKARMVGEPKRGDLKDVLPQRSPHMREVDHEALFEPRAKATTLGHCKMEPSKARNRLEKASEGWQGQTKFALRLLGGGGQPEGTQMGITR
ncbi:hypothetical protein AMTR_s00118p00059540 [Amborella trichopoda]|uniref:Uncharacterized protein n=1 Tax=Amborella trichopoda TaxID=13333 RepID=W1NNZ0_AMBTC|nr:hypothetical protein AMTR_s00118p00059540 [Amborella trichopoda]